MQVIVKLMYELHVIIATKKIKLDELEPKLPINLDSISQESMCNSYAVTSYHHYTCACC